jgi:hypothetical protein
MTLDSSDPQLIDRIVREVMRRLTDREVAVTDVTENKDLVVDESVISLATLEGRLCGVRRVVIEERAVITPAARDELNDQGIELQRR